MIFCSSLCSGVFWSGNDQSASQLGEQLYFFLVVYTSKQDPVYVMIGLRCLAFAWWSKHHLREQYEVHSHTAQACIGMFATFSFMII